MDIDTEMHGKETIRTLALFTIVKFELYFTNTKVVATVSWIVNFTCKLSVINFAEGETSETLQKVASKC